MNERDRLALEADEDVRAEAGELGDEYEEYLDEMAQQHDAELAEMLDAMEFEDRVNGGLDIEG